MKLSTTYAIIGIGGLGLATTISTACIYWGFTGPKLPSPVAGFCVIVAGVGMFACVISFFLKAINE